MLTTVERILIASLRAGGTHWEPSSAPLLAAYATAAQAAGRGRLAIGAPELQALQAAAPGIGFSLWDREDAVRALLLIARQQSPTFAAEALECFAQGDAREQQSWLRAIALWPDGQQFLSAAIDACRTNIVPVFEALACENPYPAQHFPERNFNQVVLKAMFNSIALSRIAGLASRLNPELTRMARDYAAERSAAGRTVPADIHLALDDAVPEPR